MAYVSARPFTPGWPTSVHTGEAFDNALSINAVDVDNAITALGTTQATAYQLLANMNNLTTVAASTGVALPKPIPGRTVTVFHNGVSNVKVYGNGSDTIDGTAGATGVTLTAAARCQYLCTSPTTWISALLGSTSA